MYWKILHVRKDLQQFNDARSQFFKDANLLNICIVLFCHTDIIYLEIGGVELLIHTKRTEMISFPGRKKTLLWLSDLMDSSRAKSGVLMMLKEIKFATHGKIIAMVLSS